MATINLADVQGFILRGYNMPLVRHFALRIRDAAAARGLPVKLAAGEPDAPGITTAAPWELKPEYCLNIGFTFQGLTNLRLDDASLASFPAEFIAGSAARAAVVSDTGESAPENWIASLRPPGPDILLFVWARSHESLESVTTRLRDLFARHGVVEIDHYDGVDLPDSRVHFGFKDGISQPNIDGGPSRKIRDMQPIVRTGAFLLGYDSQFTGFQYPVPAPADQLGHNGSFAAFRILKQDVDTFEKFLQDAAVRVGISPELIRAKVCGRWPNGVPLELSPTTDSPQPPLSDGLLDNFDYMAAPTNPAVDDARGARCPIGSHIRRSHPRSELVVGGDEGHKHRLVRRGMPYGPPYDPKHPDDGIERGLLGLFINVSLRDQFEFIMSQWINGGHFTAGLQGDLDPLVGANGADNSRFVIPTSSAPVVLEGVPRFVTTRGSAYCFLPSMTALRYLSRPV